MTEELDHHCRSDKHCVARTPDGAAITTKPGTLCHGCVTKLQGQLDELPAIRDALRLYLVRGGSSAQTKVAFSSTPATPLDVGTLDLIDEIDDVIDRTGGLSIADLIRQPEQEFILWSRGSRRAVFLDGVQRALDVSRVWRKADGVIGLTRKWQQRLGTCPRCTLRTLGNFAGEDAVTCSSCGGVMTRDEYDRITLIRADQ